MKYIRRASSPNFVTAFARSPASVSAAAACAGSAVSRRRAVVARTGSPTWAPYTCVARVSRDWPASVSSQRNDSRSTRAILAAGESAPGSTHLALLGSEC